MFFFINKTNTCHLNVNYAKFHKKLNTYFYRFYFKVTKKEVKPPVFKESRRGNFWKNCFIYTLLIY